MSARTQLQSKPVADLRSIAESLGIEHKGLQKAKLIDLLVEHSDDIIDTEETEVAEVISKSSKDDGPSVVSSGDSEIKKGDTREGILDTLQRDMDFFVVTGISQVKMMSMFQLVLLRSLECVKGTWSQDQLELLDKKKSIQH
jgi:hypothetical protein